MSVSAAKGRARLESKSRLTFQKAGLVKSADNFTAAGECDISVAVQEDGMRAPFGGILVGICAGLLASAGEAQNARSRRLLLLDRAHLADVVERARRGDSEITAAIASLEEDARKGLTFGPVR